MELQVGNTAKELLIYSFKKDSQQHQDYQGLPRVQAHVYHSAQTDGTEGKDMPEEVIFATGMLQEREVVMPVRKICCFLAHRLPSPSAIMVTAAKRCCRRVA